MEEIDARDVLFVREDHIIRGGRRRIEGRGLANARDWQVVADLKWQMVFPHEICVTRL